MSFNPSQINQQTLEKVSSALVEVSETLRGLLDFPLKQQIQKDKEKIIEAILNGEIKMQDYSHNLDEDISSIITEVKYG
jgi:hypothetical protein